VFSALICSIVPIEYGDRRVVRIGQVVGVPAEECFSDCASGT
jgi:hypothetical protein